MWSTIKIDTRNLVITTLLGTKFCWQ